jgi:hypothetical protein
MKKWKGFGRKRSWPNFKVLSVHPYGGTGKTMKGLREGSRSPDLELNTEPL